MHRLRVSKLMTRSIVVVLGLLILFTVTRSVTADIPDTRVSHMGPDGDTRYYGLHPAVACAHGSTECLVVWAADDNTGTLTDDEFEVYAQRIDTASGAPLGSRIRVTTLGTDGDTSIYARDPAVAYNSTDQEYFVVWAADPQSDGMADDEYEIFGQRLGLDGTPAGTHFRVSAMGTDGDPAIDALEPTVAYNHTDNEYLIVWYADDVLDNVVEIYGQRLSASGAELGTDDFRISDMGTLDDDSDFRGHQPAVAHNATDNEYLIVWEGDDDTAPLVDDEYEIFGQRLASDGTEIGANDLRISAMGPDGDTAYTAQDPAVAYDSTSNQYLVAWTGTDDASGTPEYEAYVQWLTADGVEAHGNDLQISTMGPDGNTAYRAFGAAATCVAGQPKCLVVWRGTDDRVFASTALAAQEMEIFGQWLDAATGAPTGVDDFRISEMGPDGDEAYDADLPAVAALPGGDVLIAWQGDDNDDECVDGEVEIFAEMTSHPSRVGISDLKVDRHLWPMYAILALLLGLLTATLVYRQRRSRTIKIR